MKKREPVSIIISNFNGKKILQNNLKSVLSELKKNDELLIIDDASTDDSVRYLIKKFKLKKTENNTQYIIYQNKLESKLIKLIVNQKNLRFAASVNRAVKFVQSSKFLLINNDVQIKKGVIDQLLSNFKDKKVFAVGCSETEPNKGNILGGKNKLFFKKGLFAHNRGDEFSSGETAWASGGSAMFDRAKWVKLNGFDLDYYPAYWEDVDLSYRAKQRGWKVLFDAKAKVIHNHETTNKSVFGQKKIDKVSLTNAIKFTKKHAAGLQKLKFLLFRPYWFYQQIKLNNQQYQFFLILILLLATVLRFFKLGQVPAGMTWDEAAIGYNGYAVVHTRRDEWLQRLPVSFKSFGDFKAPAAIYLSGLFTSILGLNLFAIRLPFAIFGVLGVLGIIKLTQELTRIHYIYKPKKLGLSSEQLGLISGFILAISPWHLHLTRTGFESGMALSLIIWGTYFLLKFVSNVVKDSFAQSMKMLLPAIACLGGSLYVYHSPKIFVPLLVMLFLAVHWKMLKQKPKKVIVGFIGAVLVSLPLIIDGIFGEGLTRSGSLVVLQAQSFFEALKMMLLRIYKHLAPSFLIGGKTDTLRHSPGKFGVLNLTTYLLAVFGLITSIKKILNNHFLKISLAWIFFGLMPAILGDTYPQGNRALLMLPGLIWLAVMGLNQVVILINHKKEDIRTNKTLAIIIVLFLLNFSFYLRYYYVDFPKLSSAAYQEGYIETMQLVYDYERGKNGKPEANQIIFSNQYGQPYIYALLVRKTDPYWYHGGSLIKYLFVDEVTDSDLLRPRTLVVATNEEFELNIQPKHIIFGKDRQPRFRIYYQEKQ